jgi:hypothetical protein
MDLIILNSSLTIVITLQNWTQDTFGPFSDALIKRGFAVNLPTTVQQLQVQATAPFARKGKITGLVTDYPNRRIVMQITNNITSPHENVEEILSILQSIGFPSQESIERIDIQGQINIKIQGYEASKLVPNVVDKRFINSVGKILGRNVRAVGIRLSSTEPFTSGTNVSPFVILLEPLFTDPTDTKMMAHVSYASSNGELTIDFLQHLYDRLKNIISEFKGE